MIRACSRDELAGFLKISGRRAEEIADVAETIGLVKKGRLHVLCNAGLLRVHAVCVGKPAQAPTPLNPFPKKQDGGRPLFLLSL
jgi:hypothetical protein